jgi:outer membrane protein assembly factor BamA
MVNLTAVILATLLVQTPPSQSPPPSPVFKELRLKGATVYSAEEIQDRLRLEVGRPLPEDGDRVERLADELERVYKRDGYMFAEVDASFDPDTGRLDLEVDEGRIEGVEFVGVSESLAKRLQGDVPITAGQLFNSREVRRALDPFLEEARGSVELRDPAFTPIDRNGKRIAQVNLRTRDGRAGFTLGTGAREDWFTPVGGLAPAIGFSATAFDTQHFNHTYVEGYATYRFGSDKWGYSFGVERPLFRTPRVFVGAEIHDILASDDRWRVSVDEQSLVAMAFRNTFRDYYRRRGYQLNAALQFHPQHELLASWQQDRHEAVFNETDFSFFRDDHIFRPNASITEGRIRSGVIGYLWDSRGLGRERLKRTYRRHLLDDLYGSSGGGRPGWRFEWTSEIAGGDFDFRRHILNLRRYTRLSPNQAINARLLAGFSDGMLPPQRLFGLGGIGSVHGYRFKEALGEKMALANVEYKLSLRRDGDLRNGVNGVLFFDAGRVYRPALTVEGPILGSRSDWLKGIGVGLEAGDVRLDFGWRLDDIPRSLQVLLRFTRPF